MSFSVSEPAQFLGLIVVMLGAAKLFGAAAERLGQPSVLGELLAGVLIGALGLVRPNDHKDHVQVALHLMAEAGVVLLLFQIGLETDLAKLLQVGGTSLVVAAVGVAAPFVLGYGVCRMLALDDLVSLLVAAALTATSVGITGRILADLGRLDAPESRIILGAAVIDDVLGLIILTVVCGMLEGGRITPLGVARVAGTSFGFLLGTLLLGMFLVPPLVRLIAARTMVLVKALPILGLLLAFGLAYLADLLGSAMIMGAFAAGLVLARTPQVKDIEHGVAPLGHFFVPLFFASVGAAVELRALADSWTLMVGGLLIVVAIAGKMAAGYAPFWFRGNKTVIGVGMVPRGEVGLIFAEVGVKSLRPDANGVPEPLLNPNLFGAVTLMVLVTTFLAPLLLRRLFPPLPREKEVAKPPDVHSA